MFWKEREYHVPPLELRQSTLELEAASQAMFYRLEKPRVVAVKLVQDDPFIIKGGMCVKRDGHFEVQVAERYSQSGQDQYGHEIAHAVHEQNNFTLSMHRYGYDEAFIAGLYQDFSQQKLMEYYGLLIFSARKRMCMEAVASFVGFSKGTKIPEQVDPLNSIKNVLNSCSQTYHIIHSQFASARIETEQSILGIVGTSLAEVAELSLAGVGDSLGKLMLEHRGRIEEERNIFLLDSSAYTAIVMDSAEMSETNEEFVDNYFDKLNSAPTITQPIT